MSSETVRMPKIRVDAESGKKYVRVDGKRIWLGKDIKPKDLVKFLLKKRKRIKKKKTKKTAKRRKLTIKEQLQAAISARNPVPSVIGAENVSRSFTTPTQPVVVSVTNPAGQNNNGVAEVKKELNDMKALMAPVAMFNGVGFNKQQAEQALLMGSEMDNQVQKSKSERKAAQVVAQQAESARIQAQKLARQEQEKTRREQEKTRQAKLAEDTAKIDVGISKLAYSKKEARDKLKAIAEVSINEEVKKMIKNRVKIDGNDPTPSRLLQLLANKFKIPYKSVKDSLLPVAQGIGKTHNAKIASTYPDIISAYGVINDIELQIEELGVLRSRSLQRMRELPVIEESVEVEEEPVAPVIYRSASVIGPNEIDQNAEKDRKLAVEMEKMRALVQQTRDVEKKEKEEEINNIKKKYDQLQAIYTQHSGMFSNAGKIGYNKVADNVNRMLTSASSAATSSQHPMMTRRQKAEIESAELRRKADIVDAKYDNEIANVDIFLQSIIDKNVANGRASNQKEEDIEAGVRQEEAMADIKKQEIEADRRAAKNEIYNPPVAAQPFNPASMASLDSMMQSNVEQEPIVGYDPPVQREIIAQPAQPYQNLMDDFEEEQPIGSAVDEMFGDGRKQVDEDPGLSTGQIDELMKNYRPLYLGCIARNEISTLNIKPRSRFGFIMNTDPNTKSGTHWVAIYVDATPAGEHCLDYYNSLADQPTPSIIKSIHQVMLKVDPVINLKFKVNKIADQSDDSANCGYFAAKFLMNRFKGQSFAKASGYKAQYPEGEANIEKWKKQLGIEPFMFFEDGGLHRVKSSKPIVEHRRKRGLHR